MKYIAAEGCQFSFDPASTTPASVTVTTPASTDCKAGGKGLYRGTLALMIAGYQGGAITTTGAGAGTITGSAQSVKIDYQPAVLENDSGTASITDASTGATQPVVVKIQSAGQTSVKGA